MIPERSGAAEAVDGLVGLELRKGLAAFGGVVGDDSQRPGRPPPMRMRVSNAAGAGPFSAVAKSTASAAAEKAMLSSVPNTALRPA